MNCHETEKLERGTDAGENLDGRRRQIITALAIGGLAAACRGGDGPGEEVGSAKVGTGNTALGSMETTSLEEVGLTDYTASMPDLDMSAAESAEDAAVEGAAAEPDPGTMTSTDADAGEGLRSSRAPDADAAAEGDTPLAPNSESAENLSGSAPNAAAAEVAKEPVGSIWPEQPSEPLSPPSLVTALYASRCAFGLTPKDQNDLEALGSEAWLDQQLACVESDEGVETAIGNADYLFVGKTPKQIKDTLMVEGKNKQANDRRRNLENRYKDEINHLNVVRAVYSPCQLREVMVQFWQNHFTATLIDDGGMRALQMPYQEETIRPNAMGRFVDLVKAVSVAPCMLSYLDNVENNANSDEENFNENYGREVLELHTLGIRPDGTKDYAEVDVRSNAQAFCGRSMQLDQTDATWAQFLFKEGLQSSDPVNLLDGEYTAAIQGSVEDADLALDFLTMHPSTARYLAYKLVRHFVADNPPMELVESAAQVYLENDTDIPATLRHILTSQEFLNSSGQKFRRPFELCIAAMRATLANIDVEPTTNIGPEIQDRMETMGNAPWHWLTPDGYPDTAGHWLSTQGLIERWKFVDALAHGSITDDDSGSVDVKSLVKGAATADEMVDYLAARFGLGALDAELKAQLLQLAGLEAGAPFENISDDVAAAVCSALLIQPMFQIR